MQLFSSIFFLGLLSWTLAKSVIVTYPQDTPDSVVEDAKQKLVDAGGTITHEYRILKGFAAEAPANAIQTFKTSSTEHNPTVEDDSIVTALSGSH